MRVLAASLAVLLLVAICSQAEDDHRVSRNAALSKREIKPISCCVSYISHPIPSNMIRSAYRSSTGCSLQAVILLTRKGREVCADPKAPWVQKYLQDLELLEY
ncbi:C-C motif chemokine 3-like [Oenanthe melanoleuca]|uniref:C-C motif chemokine 3-like n=1 Tax=Oenanthe melanoleuca TaxID=2939378 RepID=UPI0024C12F2E|nr:C-C motif chemokine 3-like [Oenanthe melanoleuca]